MNNINSIKLEPSVLLRKKVCHKSMTHPFFILLLPEESSSLGI